MWYYNKIGYNILCSNIATIFLASPILIIKFLNPFKFHILFFLLPSLYNNYYVIISKFEMEKLSLSDYNIFLSYTYFILK